MIIFIYGADTFRSRRFRQELKNKFRREVDPESGSLSVIDGQTATLKEIGEKINTGSLFVKKRLVVIENIFKNKKEKIFAELADYLKKYSGDEDNVLIFRDEELDTREKPLKSAAKKLFSFLAKQPYAQKFDPLNDGQLKSFLKKELESYGKEIAAPAAALLIDLVGNDLWTISKELKKLADYAENKITTEEVRKMVVGAFNENIFGLTDALSARNKKLALDLLANQYAAGSSDEYLITMLIRQFKILRQIRAAIDNRLNPAEISAQVKLHPFVVKKGIAQAKNFSDEALKNYLNRLIHLDFLNKTGQGDIKTELTLLISGL